MNRGVDESTTAKDHDDGQEEQMTRACSFLTLDMAVGSLANIRALLPGAMDVASNLW